MQSSNNNDSSDQSDSNEDTRRINGSEEQVVDSVLNGTDNILGFLDDTTFSETFLNPIPSLLPIVTQESGLDFRQFNEYRRSDFFPPIPSSRFGLWDQHTSISSSELNDNHGFSEKEDDIVKAYGISSSKPKHPQYSVIAIRLSTFTNFPSLPQTPKAFAEAGFFYSGQEDIVYCYFCGGGLRKWEPGDDPWIEHAKHKPSCGHLLNIKGYQFVQMVQKAVTNNEQIQNSQQLLESVGAQSVLSMGYSRTVVEAAIKFLMKSKKNEATPSFGAQAIMEAVLTLEEETTANGSDENVESLQEENKQLKEQTVCKICLEEKVSIVFLPCGHLCCCGQCAPALRKCPICRTFIKATVKTILV